MYLWPTCVCKCESEFLPCCIWLDFGYFCSYKASRSRDVRNLCKEEKTARRNQIIDAVGQTWRDSNQSYSPKRLGTSRTISMHSWSSILSQTVIILTTMCRSSAYKTWSEQKSPSSPPPTFIQCLHSPRPSTQHIQCWNLFAQLSSKWLSMWHLKSFVFCEFTFI